MAHTRVKVLEIVATYEKLNKELRDFKEIYFRWAPDEWFWKTPEHEVKYSEMLDNFQKFQTSDVVLDMDEVVFQSVNKGRKLYYFNII